MTAAATEIIQGASAPSVRRFSVRVLQGFGLGCEAASEAGRLTVGTDEGATLRLTDRTVSRFHAEFESIDGSVVLRDLGSSNGTRVGAVGVREVLFRRDAEVMVGRTRLALTLTDRPVAIELTVASQFGRLMGNSMAMRAVFAVLARAAPTSAPVLLTGESGTGKELAARALHDASPAPGAPSKWWTAAASRPRSSRASCSATSAGPSRARTRTRSAPSSERTAERCSSTSSGSFRSRCSPSCCGCSPRGRSGEWAACGGAMSTCAWWRRPTATCAARSTSGAFGQTCSIASR
ncbi:MAG: sigma 54-interacting transcriptional regulator [Deltaproteobacteria bacterium]|nr:sigma 54-interacting transcriptional regulator [Deltaproteobacteria bacterium]